MEWEDKVKEKAARGREIVFGKDNPMTAELAGAAEKASRAACAFWALDAAERCAGLVTCGAWEAAEAVRLSRLWAEGKIKMPLAKAAILACHGAARRCGDRFDRAVLHAVGQGCSTVHSKKHAVGLPMYLLTAVYVRYGAEETEKTFAALKQSLSEYSERRFETGVAAFLSDKERKS